MFTNNKTAKGALIALMALGVLLSGIGSAMAQSTSPIPFEEEVSGDETEIEYEIVGSDTFTNGSSVDLNVTVVGVNKSGVTTLTDLNETTVTISESETYTSTYNITENVNNTSQYDNYRLIVKASSDSSNVENIDSVVILNGGLGGGIFAPGDNGFLSGTVFGVPTIFVVVVAVVGIFLYYNDEDEFDS